MSTMNHIAQLLIGAGSLLNSIAIIKLASRLRVPEQARTDHPVQR